MAFPNIHEFPKGDLGRSEREMGQIIAALLRLFGGRAPDPESNTRVLELANTPGRWSAGHALFAEIRHRLLAATNTGDELRGRQYSFEESCCKVMYNATDPPAPFDSRTAFFVAGKAIRLAEGAGAPMEEVVIVLTGAARLTESASPANHQDSLSP